MTDSLSNLAAGAMKDVAEVFTQVPDDAADALIAAVTEPEMRRALNPIACSKAPTAPLTGKQVPPVP